MALVRATHAPPTLAVTAFVTAVGVAAGLDAARCVLLAAAILVGQASIGWANDCLDAPRDRAAGRRDKPAAVGAVSEGALAVAATVALVAVVPLSLALGWRAGAAHLVAVGSAWFYDLRAKETVASPLPFALSFGLVPVIVSTALPGSPLPRPAIVAAAACCGVAAHFANTVGDAEDDRRTGVRGLPQRIGPAASVVVAACVLGAAAGLLVAATGPRPLSLAAAAVDGAAALVVVVVTLSDRRRADLDRADRRPRHLAFNAVIVAVGVLVAAFVVAAGHSLTA